MQLSKIYKQNGIRHRRPKYSISCRRPDEQLLLLQQRFCEQLIEKLRINIEVIYIDETSTHLWEKRLKVWHTPCDPIVFKLPSNRGQSHTVIGAISSDVSKPLYWQLAQHTNTESFNHFMSLLLRHYCSNKCLFILDNHTAHHSLKFRNFIEKQGLKVLYLPPGGSALNPIERVWAMLKTSWA
jgi:hypothetical protein